MSPAARTSLKKPAWLPFALLAVIPVLGLLLAAQLVASTPMNWGQAIEVAFETWRRPGAFFWAALLVSGFAPIERRKLVWSIPVHLAALVALTLWFGAPERPQPPVGMGRDRRDGPPPEFLPGPGEPPPLREGPPPELRRGIRGERRMGAVFFSSQVQLSLAAYLGAVGLLHAFAVYFTIAERDRRARELAANLTHARLTALQLQLQPHFLFNSLNAISTLVHKDAHAADEMITNLSELLRLSLATKAPVVPLSQELGLLDRYVAIEQVRFGSRLKFERAIEPSTLEAYVPTLLLQPIVENAVRHGLEPKPGPGVIRVVARIERERLLLIVEDDGVGLGESARQPGAAGGVGLDNTTARLRELYGSDATVTIGARDGGGVRVTLDLPAVPPLDTLSKPPPVSTA